MFNFQSHTQQEACFHIAQIPYKVVMCCCLHCEIVALMATACRSLFGEDMGSYTNGCKLPNCLTTLTTGGQGAGSLSQWMSIV